MITQIVASASGAQTAVAAPGASGQSYEQLASTVRGVGRTLRAAGVGRSGVVASLVPAGPASAVCFLGAASAAVSAPLDPSLPLRALEGWLDDVKPDLLVIGPGIDEQVVEAISSSGIRLGRLSEDTSIAGAIALDVEAGAASSDSLDPEPDDVALLLHTSGTTAQPKRVPITHGNLAASAANIGRTLGLGRDDRCLDVMPLFHIHGLVAGVLASLFAGGTVICTPPFNGADVFAWIEEQEPTWMTAVPTMYQGILDRADQHAEMIRRSPLRLLRSSSSALPEPVHRRLEDVFGLPVVEAYGMTEAAHQISSNTAEDRVAGTVGKAAGPEVSILGDDDAPLTAGEVGKVAIRGANVIGGYADPVATAEAFVDGWFLTGDLGSLDGEGRLRLTGRFKEMINRGGETIAPGEIDDVLLSHADVARAMAFAVPDHRLGEQVAALVVLADGATAGPDALRRHAAEHLAPARVPRRIIVVDDLPRGPTGKPRRIGIASELGLVDLDGPPTGPAPFVAPDGPVQRLVHQLWTEVLEREGIGVNDRFFDSGGDSLLAMRLLARVADAIDVEISMLDFFDRPTIAEQSTLIEEALLG